VGICLSVSEELVQVGGARLSWIDDRIVVRQLRRITDEAESSHNIR
jgi:hypothetical protein